MKKIIFTFFLLFSGLCILNAQSNAILFTENGERFYAILNGLRQNDKPQTNVKITGLNANFYKLRIIFEDTKLGEKNFNLGLETSMETTFTIKKNTKGIYVLRPMSTVPIAEAPVGNTNQQLIVFNPNALPYSETTIQSTTTTTNTTGKPNGESLGVNINADGANFNINVTGGTSTNNTTTTTTTTTSKNETLVENKQPIIYLPGYSGHIGCPMPVGGAEFSQMKKSIEAKSFEESKFTVAKQIVNNNCLLSSQVKQILLLFSFEQTRLDFAKYCYGYTYDIGNYYKINDAFSFESSIDELNEYINTFQK